MVGPIDLKNTCMAVQPGLPRCNEYAKLRVLSGAHLRLPRRAVAGGRMLPAALAEGLRAMRRLAHRVLLRKAGLGELRALNGRQARRCPGCRGRA